MSEELNEELTGLRCAVCGAAALRLDVCRGRVECTECGAAARVVCDGQNDDSTASKESD
ncbi:hypothetical protein [Nonomuraea sediminis]|uniref:hypothetical protein n=1 Tax=Nonomuraea sediminis TaxID=2835864 RepID=UPI001BDDBD61|nr:hypothetical protein [Nonomuraea sediminis]